MMRIPNVLTRSQAQSLLDLPNPETWAGLRMRALLEVLYRGGLRSMEVSNLERWQVDWENGWLHLRTTKGKKPRDVPIPDSVVGWLDRWLDAAPESEWVFCSRSGTRLSTAHLRVYHGGFVKQAKKKDLLPNDLHVSLHTWRHTYATELLEDGFTLAEVQLLLGHSQLTSTQVYLHVRPQTVWEKVRTRT